jgi:hypothetical protein
MIYPSLPAPLDLGVARLNGAGFGNCLFAYFHAVVLGEREHRRLIAPSWRSIPIDRKLRGDGTIRRYHAMVRAHPEELTGAAKAAALAALLPVSERQQVAPGSPAHGSKRPLIVIGSTDFTFEGLHPHRALLRRRLLEIMRNPPAEKPEWGSGGYLAVHVRLGDFDPIGTAGSDNLRLPLAWYAGVIARLRGLHPELPVRLFSDGGDAELAELLAIEGVTRARAADDINELVGMAGASVLVGSQSTFSRWAAFLGNMPAIWRAPVTREGNPLDPDIRSQVIGDDIAVLADPLA